MIQNLNPETSATPNGKKVWKDPELWLISSANVNGGPVGGFNEKSFTGTTITGGGFNRKLHFGAGVTQTRLTATATPHQTGHHYNS